MNYVVFDTETTSLNKPFAYNIGYIILNENGSVLVKKDFVVEQIWHNLPLFSTAYYSEKRPIYISAMKSRKTVMKKFGYICQEMIRDFKKYEVTCAYAYNSSFDEKVFDFNCDWFKCANPFDDIPIYDIRGNVHQFLFDDKYRAFCEKYNFYTESGCYSSTAETVYRYITGLVDWNEDHTALSDSEIEATILEATLDCGAELNRGYTAKRSLGTPIVEKTLVIKTDKNIDCTCECGKQKEYYFTYESIKINKDKTEIKLK